MHAVPIGIRPYDRNEQPPKDDRVTKSNKAGWDRAVGFVLGIFVKPYCLIRGNKLKKVEPNPEGSFWNV